MRPPGTSKRAWYVYPNVGSESNYCEVGVVPVRISCTVSLLFFVSPQPIGTSQSCLALQPHASSSWWYSWSTTSGFSGGNKGSFCEDAATAVGDARAAGMDFVPMFWGGVPSQPLTGENHDNLVEANYLMTFNEPEITAQSNVLPAVAAQMWPEIEGIAASYNLELVAPCTTGDKGIAWYNQWLGNCTLLGYQCSFDYTCIHLYYQPWDSTTGSCAPGVYNWACIGDQAVKATNKIDQWYTTYGKTTWVTEWACAPWGGADCDEAKHHALMEQMLPVLHGNPKVFRYSWYTMFDSAWIYNSLNELVWQRYNGQVCPAKKWLKGFGTQTWQIQTLHECVAAADADTTCVTPLALSIDDDNCYCATDLCDTLDPSYAAMNTYKEIGPRQSSTLTTMGQYYNDYGASSPLPPSPGPTTPSPTLSPAATCLAPGDGLGCNELTNCCSGVGSCTGGTPADRVCLGCGGNKASCTTADDCCSGKCRDGKCKGSRRLADRISLFGD